MNTLSVHNAPNINRNSATFISKLPATAAPVTTKSKIKFSHSIAELPSSINARINSFCNTPSPLPLCNWNLFIQLHVSQLETEETEAKTALTLDQRKRVYMFVMKELSSMRSFLPRTELAKIDIKGIKDVKKIKDPYLFPCSFNPNSSYFNYLPLRKTFYEARHKQENVIVEHMKSRSVRITPSQFCSVFWYAYLNAALEANENQPMQPSQWNTFANKIEDNPIVKKIEDNLIVKASIPNSPYISNAFRDTVDRLYSPSYAFPGFPNNLQLPKPIDLLFIFLDNSNLVYRLSFDDLKYALLYIFETELSAIQKNLIYYRTQFVGDLVKSLFEHLETKMGDRNSFEKQLQGFLEQLKDFLKVKAQEFETYTRPSKTKPQATKSKIDHLRQQSKLVYNWIKTNLADFPFPEEFIEWVEAVPKCCCVIL